MSVIDYNQAKALGQKEYRACVSSGRYPYLQVLDDILSYTEIQREEPLGLVDIPVDHIVGTKTAGRTNAFAANFMPLLNERSEFAGKWANLSTAHIEEGIRDPIIAYEYMNRFYVSEGNKRVSVMKYFGAVTIPGNVRRIVPKPQETDESLIYSDFLDFYKLTKINFIWFSQPGRFKLLLGKLNDTPHVWTEEEQSEFRAAYFRFRSVFKDAGGDKLQGTTGDAFLAYLNIHSLATISKMAEADMRKSLQKSWSELAASSVPEPVDLELDPKDTGVQPSILSKILPIIKPDRLNVLYIYERSPETSSWSHAHDEGRKTAEKLFEGKVTTRYADNVSPANFAEVIKSELEKGDTDVVFATSPKHLNACIKAAAKYPDVKFLNCSIYSPHPTIRSYYGRLYEVKFLAGLIAGTMTQTHKIGYLADYPIYGTPAAVNAFAKGARMTDPYAEVYLRWNSQQNENIWDSLVSCGVDMIAGLDSWSPVDIWRAHGLYKLDGSVGKQIFKWQMNWGQFYIRILREILDGGWKSAPDKEKPKAVNYWWGLTADVFDIEYMADFPWDTLQLVSLLKDEIISGKVSFFDQAELAPDDIVKMDSFSENVIGAIPDASELTEDARELIKIQGILPGFREDSI